jgi:transposase
MATAVKVRTDFSAAELRRVAAASKHANQSRRLLSIAAVLDGMSRAAAARIGGMDRQTLRDWVHRYNAEGLAGLHDRPRPGPRPRLTPEQLQKFEKVVEEGPDPVRDGVVRWRRVDLQAWIKAQFGLELHERSVGKLLRRQGFVRLSVRPHHPSSDPAAQAAFKQTSPSW